MKRYVAINRERQGPLSFEEIENMFSAGQLKADDLAWQSGMPEWKMVTEVWPDLAESESAEPIAEETLSDESEPEDEPEPETEPEPEPIEDSFSDPTEPELEPITEPVEEPESEPEPIAEVVAEPESEKPIAEDFRESGEMVETEEEEETETSLPPNDLYVIPTEGERKGPLQASDTISMCRPGEIKPETLAWRDGMEKWRPLSEIWPAAADFSDQA